MDNTTKRTLTRTPYVAQIDGVGEILIDVWRDGLAIDHVTAAHRDEQWHTWGRPFPAENRG